MILKLALIDTLDYTIKLFSEHKNKRSAKLYETRKFKLLLNYEKNKKRISAPNKIQ